MIVLLKKLNIAKDTSIVAEGTDVSELIRGGDAVRDDVELLNSTSMFELSF